MIYSDEFDGFIEPHQEATPETHREELRLIRASLKGGDINTARKLIRQLPARVKDSIVLEAMFNYNIVI